MNTLTICLIICLLTIISYVWGKISMAATAMLSRQLLYLLVALLLMMQPLILETPMVS